MPALVLLAVMMVLGLLSIGAWRAYIARSEDIAAVGACHALTYSEADPFSSLRVPFETFGLGDERGVRNLLWGATSDDAFVRVFDYWYRDGDDESHGPPREFTCAVTQVAAVWPHLVIRPVGSLGRFIDGLTGVDIEFESEEFNRAFTVTCDDRRFASTFVDPQMMEFLLSTDRQATFEVRGRWVLCVLPRVPPRLMPAAIGLSNAFRHRVPALVRELYTTLPA